MKLETRIQDLKTFLALDAAKAAAGHALDALAEETKRHDDHEKARAAFDTAWAAAGLRDSAGIAFDKIPKQRRELALATKKEAVRQAQRAAATGESYSGTTDYAVQWGETPEARTITHDGDRYKGKASKYTMTDATHLVTLCPEGAPLLLDCAPLANRSFWDGLPLIALFPQDRAVWVRSVGKRIEHVKGWIVGDGLLCFHSTESREHAQRGLAKKRAAAEKEREAQKLRDLDRVREAKEERRARLIARLCGSVVATVADARALGFCAPGIEAFQAQHGIGDSASLPDLVRTGRPEAIRLALALARRVNREGQQKAA